MDRPVMCHMCADGTIGTKHVNVFGSIDIYLCTTHFHVFIEEVVKVMTSISIATGTTSVMPTVEEIVQIIEE